MAAVAPMPPALRDPTAAAAITRADIRLRPRTRRGVRYDPHRRIRRGGDRLEVTLFEAIRMPLRWETGRVS